jgi:molecular chaperone GrpE
MERMSDEKSDPSPTNDDQPSTANSRKAEMQGDTADPAAQATACLEALIAENADMRDRLLRIMAEMENLRRRTEREKSDTARFAISNFAREVLTVGDNLRRTLEHVAPEAESQDPALKSFLDGVELTERELVNVLERHGIKRIEPLG